MRRSNSSHHDDLFEVSQGSEGGLDGQTDRAERKSAKRAKKVKGGTSGQKENAMYYCWTKFQQRRYIRFLKDSGHLLELSHEERRIKKVNQLMSKKLKSRNSTQCHTHHQKMLAKYITVGGIILAHSFIFDNKAEEKVGDGGVTSESPLASEPAEWMTIDEILMSGPILSVATQEHRQDRKMSSIDEVEFYEVNSRELLEWLEGP